jgi:AraC-like DNA-binding protein
MGEYRELAPEPRLQGHLVCVWYKTAAPDDPPRPLRVLPDACVDIVWEARTGPRVAGPDTGPVVDTLVPGTMFAGVRFRPGRAADLLGVAADELRDRQPELAAVWGESASRRLCESGATGSVPAMLRALQDEVAGRLDRARADRCVPAVVAWARRQAGLGELTGELGLGERQLRRRVEERFGYGPAVLRRVLRLQRLLALAAQHPRSLAELAQAAGYADQAHMTRECQRLGGLSPSRLLAEWIPTLPPP